MGGSSKPQIFFAKCAWFEECLFFWGGGRTPGGSTPEPPVFSPCMELINVPHLIALCNLMLRWRSMTLTLHTQTPKDGTRCPARRCGSEWQHRGVRLHTTPIAEHSAQFLGDLRSLVRFVSFWKKPAKSKQAKSNHLPAVSWSK